MPSNYLHREDAPFSGDVWKLIDETVVKAAKSRLTVRRLLEVDGPYGLGLKTLDSCDYEVEEKTESGVEMTASCPAPVAVIRTGFNLAIRDIAQFEGMHLPMQLSDVAHAALKCADQEDALLLYGSKALGIEGLMTAKNANSKQLSGWNEVGKAADDIIGAVTEMDKDGFAGPYVLALSAELYNKLYRRYENSESTELEHIKQIVSGGVVKAAAIKNGGLLFNEGRQFATIVLGQDLMTGFVGPAEMSYEFIIRESVALRLMNAKAFCILK